MIVLFPTIPTSLHHVYSITDVVSWLTEIVTHAKATPSFSMLHAQKRESLVSRPM